jgi:putative PIN family toxin of toxin-antitoxin system
MRTVIDTNVAVSAVLIPTSVCRHAFDLAAARGKLLLSEATIAELDDVLSRPKFDKYVSKKLRLEFLASLISVAEAITISQPLRLCRDPNDDKFLELAINGSASHLISGDLDLLELGSIQATLIVSPDEFLAQFEKTEGVLGD